MIPDNYKSLPGFKTIYSETELLQAIAVLEALNNNLAMALPSGSATAANQSTANTLLSSLDSKTQPLVATISPISTDGTSGDKTIVTPSSGKALRISSIYLTAPSSVAITVKRSATAVSGAMSLIAAALEFSPVIGFSANEALVLNVGSSVAVTGFVTYWEI